MFGKRALQITFAKKNDTSDGTQIDTQSDLNPEKINELLKDQVKNAAIATIVVIGVSFFLRTISEIAINATKPKDK